jgi:hypothetical protein
LRESAVRGPFSTSHPEGISTETIGLLELDIECRISLNRGLAGGLNENPNTAS